MAIRDSAGLVNINEQAAPANQAGRISTWQAIDTWTIILLGFSTLLTRLPFRAQLLDSFDAVNYALALEHFDMRLAQPQAPGYPLYILIGRAAKLIHTAITGRGDHLEALIWVSMIFSGLAVAAIYLAGRELFDRRAASIAAILLSTSTVFWYMGEIAAPYTLDLFASALAGWLSYKVIKSSGTDIVWLAALVVGLAGALRLQTLLFLFPLFLYALFAWRAGENGGARALGVRLAAAALALLVFGVFFLPAVMSSGGPAAFLGEMRGILPIFRDTDTLIRSTRWIRFAHNLDTIARYTLRILGEIAIAFALVGFLRNGPFRRGLSSSRLVFLSVWLLPSWTLYMLIWPGNLGTMLVSMPVMFLLAGVGWAWLLQRGRLGVNLGGAALAALITWNCLVFAVLPSAPFGKAYRTFDNYASLQRNVQVQLSRLELVKELPVDGTLIFTDDFRHLQYYLPQYHAFSYPRFDPQDSQTVKMIVSLHNGKTDTLRQFSAIDLVPEGARRLVFFDPPGVTVLSSQLVVQRRSTQAASIQIVSIPEGYLVEWTPDGLDLLAATPIAQGLTGENKTK